MKKISSPVVELATTLVLTVVPIITNKVKTARKEKKRIKDGNIFVLKPENRS